MPKTSKAKAAKKRVKVEKLLGKTKKLSMKEAGKVKGGGVKHKMFAIVDRTQ